ncbi:MAG: pantoate--beta-alanine ligase [Paracoccaceae bacterium]|nr:pantoate--beta-alanine ligase [Paracoccaceae bacterium]
MTAPRIVRRLDALREQVTAWKSAGESVAVVPTMGALHAGHLSLVEAAAADCDRVIVTIFVNPKQFNNPDDLASYPRTEEDDSRKLADYRVDLIYAPDADQVYRPGFSTNVSVSGVSEGLCGAHRPGHFDGVATVVTKLFLQTQADKAFFGEKDYQQLQVVKRLVSDLDIPIEVIGCPTVRDADGLALSSRNLLLSAEQRLIAPTIHAALTEARDAIRAGADVAGALEDARRRILDAGFDSVEYLELRDAGDLHPLATADRPARLLAAAVLGKIRLIDNIAV